MGKSPNAKRTWSKQAHKNLQKRIDKTAKKPNSYAMKQQILDAIPDTLTRY